MDYEQEKLTQYLLGRLPESEQAELENKFMADDTYFEELLIVEEDLRDAYARGELSGPDRDAFERRLLSKPQHRQRQQFAQTLLRYQGRVTARRTRSESTWQSLAEFLRTRPFLVPALSGVVLVLLATSLWLLRRGGPPLGTTPETASHSDGGSAVPKPTPAEEPKTIALLLASDLVRSAGQSLPTLIVPADVERVRLEVPIQTDYPRYETILKTVEGKTISRNTDLEPQASSTGKKLIVLLPSSLLPPEDYILSARGLLSQGRPETVGEYSFRISKK
jgi:hypothetical protein